MKKSMKRILCGVLSLGLCATVATENALRWNAKGENTYYATTANASLKNVTGMFDTSAMREAYFNDSVLETEDLAPVYETRTVLITLSGDNLIDRAEDSSVENFMNTFTGEVAKSDIAKEQTNFLQALKEKGIPYKLEHTYNAVVNGVAVELDTKYVSEIKKMKGVESVVITTSYAYPTSEEGEGSGSGVVENLTTVRETGIYNSDAYTKDYGTDEEGNPYTNYGTGMVVAVLDTGLDYTHEAFQDFKHNLDSKDIAWSRNTVASKMNGTLSAEARSGSLDVSDVYLSPKVPFAYDYADDDADVYPSYSNHGTHVAGIIGGYNESGYTDKDGNEIDLPFVGVVPDAQLMICKVFTDDLDDKDLGGAVSEDIVAALDDCVKMGVDVINMSLGSSCGFSTTNDGDDEGNMLNKIYDDIGKAGISLICAASNDYSAGYGGVYGTNLTSNPDAGTVGSPSTYASALSVASINGQKASYMIANPESSTDKSFVFFEEARDINSNPMEFVNTLMTDSRYNKYGQETESGSGVYEFEYVVIPGVGEGHNYSGQIASLLKEGRIALIKRGETSFEEKVRLAQSMGAIGVIIYNNVSGSIRMNLGEIEDPVPSVSIGRNAGEAMVKGANRQGVGKIRIAKNYAAGPFMSEFSSWGPTPDLHMKPEITAHGGEITSAVPGGYGEQSGTSMASPNMAGFAAIVRSYLTQEHPELITTDGKIDKVKLNNLVMQLTMSTAGIVYDQDGLPYSPRKQGAGVAKLENVIGTNAYIWTDENSSSWEQANSGGRPKIELGDNLHDPDQKIEFTFYVSNFGKETLSFQAKSSLMTETPSSDGLTVSEQAHLLSNSNVKFFVNGKELAAGSSFDVAAGANTAVSVEIELGRKDREYIEKYFVNGMYVEGFATLVSKSAGQCDMNVPFMGFYGDWEQAPMLDYSAYEVAASAQDPSIVDEADRIKASVWATQPYNIYYNEKYVLPMGGYLYLLPEDADEMYVDEEHNAVSRYNDYYGEGNVNNYMTSTGIKAVYAGLLRNAREVRYTLTDVATGEVLISKTIDRVAKAYAGGGSAVPANVKLEIFPEEEGFIANGKYRMDFEFIRENEEDMPEDAKNTFSFSFTVDYEAPVLQEARVRFENYKDGNKEKQRVHLDIDVFDNHYAQTLMLCYPRTKANGDVVVQLLTDYPTPIRNAVKNGITTVSLDITDIYEKYGNTLYLQVDDYALNTCLYQLDINQAHANSIPDDGFALAAGEDNITLDLYEMHKTEVIFGENYKGDADEANLLWKSSNPNVAIVQNGQIVGVGEGSTTVIVNNRKGQQKTIYVRVSGNLSESLQKIPSVSFGVIQTESNAWTKATGDVEVAAGKELTLEIQTDPWYHPMTNLRVLWESTNESVATVPTDEYGKRIVINTLQKGNTQIRATIQEYVDGQWVNTQYRVGVTLRVQKEFKVSNFTLTEYNGLGYNKEDGVLWVPDDMNIMYIGENAFEDNDTIKAIVLPSSVVDIRARAFMNCTALEAVYFVDTEKKDIADADLAMIYESAFEGCINLKKVDFRNVKTVTVAQDCFKGCTNLTEVLGMPKIGTMHHRAFAGTALTSVDLSGLHMSGTSVFENCLNLTTITDTSKFSAIGKYMFRGCTNLEGEAGTLTLKTPKIGEGAFSGCTALQKVIIDGSVKELDIGKRAFEKCGTNTGENFEIVFMDGSTVRAIGEKAFINSTLASFDFSKVQGLEVLGENAFQYTRIKEINLSDTLVQIIAGENGEPDVYNYIRFSGIPFEGVKITATGSTYFQEEGDVIYDKDKQTILYVNASVVGEFTVANGVKAIGDYAFAGSKISKIVFADSVQTIGVGAFENSTLTEIDFANSQITKIPVSAFEGSYLRTITLPAQIAEIGAYAFASSDLANFYLAENSELVSIGDFAFASCEAMQSIDLSSLGGGVKRSMGSWVFYDCTALTSAKLPSLTSMGSYTFVGASKLTTVEFGADSTTTGEYTFSGMDTSLHSAYVGAPITSVKLPDNITKIETGVFNRCTKLETITLPASCIEIADFAFNGCTALKEVQGLENVQIFGTQAFYTTALPELNLQSATKIGYMAFAIYDGEGAEYTKYTKITLENVEEIGDFAFFNGGETKVELPTTLQSLGVAAFASSDNLREISMKENSESAKFFDDGMALYRRTDTEGQYELVCYPTANQQHKQSEVDGTRWPRTYTVQEGTVRIQAYAFAYLNENMVEQVNLPYTLKSIGDGAFFVSGITHYNFESIVAPTLETSYRAEVRDAIAEDEAIAAYKGYYYTNFQTYLYHFTKYGNSASPLTIYYPSNGSGYTNPIYTMYFGEKKASATALKEDETRALITLVKEMESVETVASWLNASPSDSETRAKVDSLSANMRTARGYYNDAVKDEGQKAYIVGDVQDKLLALEAQLRAVKKHFGIQVSINRLSISEESTHKNVYAVGESFDMTGLVLVVEYDDLSTEIADFSDLTLLTTGALADYMETVNVSYKGEKTIRIPIQVEEPKIPSENEPDVDEDNAGDNEEGKSNGNMPKILLIAGISVAVVAIGVGVFFVVRKKRGNK